jgi:O-antigen ligase
VSNLDLTSAGGSAAQRSDAIDFVIRSALFVAVFLIVWASFQPFRSLAEATPEVAEEGNRVNQIGYTVLFLLLAAWAFLNNAGPLKLLLRPALILLLLWFALCVVTSWEPALSARRLAFSLIVMAIAAMVMLLPTNLRHFTALITTATLIVLTLSYLGLLFAPSLAIHQPTDFLEPEHAGSWRGVFPHKNQAGATMVVFFFIGIFVARARNLVLGAAIVALAAIFLAFSNSKTATALLPVVLIVAAFIANCGRTTAIVLVLALIAFLNLLSVGSIYFEPVRGLLNMILSDASFTGRTDIWQFAIEHIMRRPILGYGFSAFWGTEQVVHGLSQGATWATAATDAHNGYLNLAVTIGLPGLVLVLIWLAVLPLVDFYRRREAAAQPLQMLYLRVWLFGLFASCFESGLFQQVGEVWFFMLTATFGLRYLSVSRLAV